MSLRSRFTVFAEASAAGFADFRAIYPRHSWLLGGTLRSASQVVFFGLVGTLLGSREHERFLVIGNAVMAAALQSSMVVANIALERRAGTFPLIVSSPANPAVVLLGRNVAWPLPGVAVGLASLLLVGPFFGVTLTPGRVLLLVPLVALVALSTFCFSFVLASVALRSVAIRDVLSALTGLGLMTLCGVQVPVAFWPSPVRVLSNVLPLTHGLGAIRAALAGQPAGPVIRGALLECLVAATWAIMRSPFGGSSKRLQERTEEVLLHLARRARTLTGSSRLCMAGGVAMNCVAVGRIAASGLFDEVSVPSAPGDSGTALGAAIAVHLTQAGAMPDGVAGACYLGPAYPVGPEGPEVGPRLQVQRIDEAAAFVADQLAGGAIVGVFQGRLEAGPRALGNRSILASPLVADVVERLNATVKFRESFRPFAPVVSTDAATTFFRLPQPSPFMSMAVPVTDLARERIPTIVAANGTSRVQTVTKEQNPFLARVIESFRARTRVPVLINTSLNVKGKPICGTPQMALECLAHSGLDGLLLEGRWWVTKAKKSELPLPVELDREQMENEAAGR